MNAGRCNGIGLIANGSGLGRGAVFFSVASALLAVIIGVLVYNEKVNTLQALGMALGIVAIGLIYWE
jgi:drug/metabolite transporter (DMT)-like permease